MTKQIQRSKIESLQTKTLANAADTFCRTLSNLTLRAPFNTSVKLCASVHSVSNAARPSLTLRMPQGATKGASSRYDHRRFGVWRLAVFVNAAGSTSAPPHRTRRVVAVVLLAIVGFVATLFVRGRETLSIPYFTTPLGVVRAPLPYRIVSFHRGRADKRLIQLAAQLGFNGVQFQIEGSNVEGIQEFADRDRLEHLVDFCHARGMQVTVWVHELSDLPSLFSDDYLGPIRVDNEALWKAIDQRYEWILGTAVPNVDGLVLTTVETQVNATYTPVMLKLVKLLDDKCRQHGKTLTVRTFVWYPDELEDVMATIRQMPADIPVMSKAVPQDWQMRGGHAAEIGAVGDRPQIIEWDVEGEYFLHNAVANCMVDRLKEQFDYGLKKNVQGICVRVDRADDNVLFEPSEVNLWALGLLAAGTTDSTDEIWARWSKFRYGDYGDRAAAAVVEALKPTGKVVEELLSIGPFTFGDTRYFPYTNYRLSKSPLWLPDDAYFNFNWQMWRWDPAFEAQHKQATIGDPAFVNEVARQKAAALKVADECLQKLEAARGLLPKREFDILHTRLMSNKVQLQFRTPMALAALHIRQYVAARELNQPAAARQALLAYNQDLTDLKRIAQDLEFMPAARTLRYLGKDWPVEGPLIGPWVTEGAVLREWADAAASRPADY